MNASGLPAALRSLAHRNFRLFIVGQTISVVGSWMQSVALGWLVYRLTGSELLLGLIGFADRIPVFVLGMAGGLAADRFDRRRIVVITQTASMLQAAALGLIVSRGTPSMTALFVLATLQGVINAFDLPARQSFISLMVAKEDLPNALALNSSVFNAARVVGPAIAGVLVASVGEGPCFLINALSYMAVLGGLLAMRVAPGGDEAVAPEPARLLAGIRYAWTTPPVRALLLLLGLVSLCGIPYTVLMPIFAGPILGSGPGGLGALMSASGVGAFLAAVLLARRPSVRGLGRTVALAASGFGAALILFALSRSFLLSMVLLLLAGFSMITQAAATNLLLQSLIPDSLRGRVMSLYTIMFVGMGPWGSLMAGSLAHAAGAPVAVAAGGAACVVGGIVFDRSRGRV